MQALVAAVMHMLTANVCSWHCQDLRFEPSMTDLPPTPRNCSIRFPRSLQESVCLWGARHRRKEGCRVVTDFQTSSILL